MPIVRSNCFLLLVFAKVLFCFLSRRKESVALDADSAFGACELDGVEAIVAAAHDGLFYSDTGRNEIDCLAYAYAVGCWLPFHTYRVEDAAGRIK